MATRKGKTTNFSPLFVIVGFGIRDPGSGTVKNQGNIRNTEFKERKHHGLIITSPNHELFPYTVIQYSE